MSRRTVLVVEDSVVMRTMLAHVIGQDSTLELMACVESAEMAIARLAVDRPDVISMDVNLPGIDGLSATRRIMQSYPTPIVIVSGRLRKGEAQLSIEALKAGALAVAEKPPDIDHPQHHDIAARLCTQLRIMSEVPVVRQRLVDPGVPAPSAPGIRKAYAGHPRVIGMVASTGGPAALSLVCAGLSQGLSVPLLLVQHIASGF